MRDAKIFSIPSCDHYNPSITLARMGLSLYVLFCHVVFWYDYYCGDIHPWLRSINLYLFKVLQGTDETNLGVIAFITISGFCIHRQGLRMQPWDLKSFMIRRFLRIYPIFILATLLGVVVFNVLKADPKITSILYTQQITWPAVLYKLLGLFALIPYKFNDIAYLGNGPLMTCAVEVWLYIFYPVFAVIIIKYGARFFWALLSIITMMGIIAYVMRPELKSWWHNGSLLGFLIYWWLGVYAVGNNKLFNNFKIPLLLFIALSIILNIHANIFAVEVRKIVFAILIGTGMRWLELHPLKRFYGLSFFESGYSLYALHTPLFCLAVVYAMNFYIMCGLILLLAYFSYICIERPIINFSKNPLELRGMAWFNPSRWYLQRLRTNRPRPGQL